MAFLIYFLVLAIRGCIFGVATQRIIDNRGFEENWFWWGFFFGISAMLVAISKPQRYVPQVLCSEPKDEGILKQGGWKCTCGRVNPSYTGTCACGKRKDEVANLKQTHKKTDEDSKFDEIKKYKELFDSGIITEEEFNKKKIELLRL